MNASTRTRILAVGLAAMALFGVAGCDNETPPPQDIARDVKIATYQGKDIYVNCLPSQDALKDKIQERVEYILSYTGDNTVDVVKNYIQQKGLKIIIEDVPEYSNNEDYRMVSDNSFAIRVAFVSTAKINKLLITIVNAVGDMNGQYQIVMTGNQFNNATGNRQAKSAYASAGAPGAV
jgi:hypothetical protein